MSINPKTIQHLEDLMSAGVVEVELGSTESAHDGVEDTDCGDEESGKCLVSKTT
jgi:hypothetical protein